MDINAISPYIRRATRSLLPANTKIRQRIILDYEIIYLESGSMRLVFDGVEYLCRAGDFIFLRPGISHSIEVLSRTVSQPHIHFDMRYSQSQSERRFVCFKDLPDLTEGERELIHRDILSGLLSPVIPAADREMIESLYKIIDDFKKRDIASQLGAKALLTGIIGKLLARLGETAATRKAEPLSQMIKQFIDGNIGEKITLSLLEDHFHYNKFYIEKRFREDMGEPISKYYNRHRLVAIKKFLELGASVTETAHNFGFDSIYSFSRYFKNAEGISPSEYAKQKSLSKS